MLPALSSRHRHAPLSSLPSRVSLLLGLGVEQGSKNPGTSTKALKARSALHRDPLLPSQDPTREGQMDTPPEPPSLPQSSPAVTVPHSEGLAKVSREARPSGTGDLAPHPVSLARPRGTARPCILWPSLASKSSGPLDARSSTLRALQPPWGRAGVGAPDGIARPGALT